MISRIIKVDRGYHPKPQPYGDLDYSGYHVNQESQALVSKIHCTLSANQKSDSSVYNNLCYLPTVSFDQL